MDLHDQRTDYVKNALSKQEMQSDPIEQFKAWYDRALASDEKEPNGMTLATSDVNGRPSARIVLIKEVIDTGFVFYTNYSSRKGQELDGSPAAALLFWWPTLERQIRIEGNVERYSEEASIKYFQSRPKSSQIGAWASPQSRVIENRSALNNRVEALTKKHEADSVLPKPAFWGGYLLVPTQVEFWQGRASRLHDRIRYRLDQDHWIVERLAP